MFNYFDVIPRFETVVENKKADCCISCTAISFSSYENNRALVIQQVIAQRL